MEAYLCVLALMLIFVGHHHHTSAYFEFCMDNKLYSVRYASCEYGVLFKEPTEVGCTYPKEQDYTVNICSDEKFSFELTGATTRPNVQHLLMTNDDSPIEVDEEPYMSEGCAAKCSGPVVEINPTLAPLPEGFDEVPYSASEEITNEVNGIVNNDAHVRDQTERLFLYLAGMLVDEGEGGPHARFADIMRQSFAIFRNHCPSNFVSKRFGELLEKSFFFLLRESDTGRIKDISEEDYEEIKRALTSCAHMQPTPFGLDGHVCEGRGTVQNISSRVVPITQPYTRTMDSFRWGKYDVAVDASWSIVDFVHGLCYGKFSQNVNKHHQYEVAVETVFTEELTYRWERPFKLGVPEGWDHVLESNMKETMRAIDACVQGAYLGSPFLRRLQRPITKMEQNLTRKKRQLESGGELEGRVFCFVNTKEANDVMALLKRNCSVVTKEDKPTSTDY